jgi:ATP-dependent helicase/nuclease subunit A
LQNSKISYTPAQEAAIIDTGKNLLVSAAAGSGKTAVLVERIIRLITNPDRPLDIDRILVVTFTDAAATEMRQRISEAIYDKLGSESLMSETPQLYEHLKRQSVLLNKAQISTLHSFCLNVMRTNFFAIGIDPLFKIADKTESDLLKLKALDNMLDKEYVKPDSDEKFASVYQAFSEKGDAEALRSNILKLYEFLSSTYWQDEWIELHKNEFDLSDADSIDNTPWAKIVKDEVHMALSGAVSTCRELLEIARNEAFGYDVALEDDLEQMEAMLEAVAFKGSAFEDVSRAIKGYAPATLKAAKGIKVTESEAHKKVKDLRDKSIKKIIKKLESDFFMREPALIINELKDAYGILDELCRLTKAFLSEYSELKKDKNLLDFNDLEINCIKCLLTEDSTSENQVLSQTSINLREKFAEIMVDEYQDINELQELILNCVSDGNCFMVGDLKQSIYRFRQAKPELFSSKYKSFSYDKDSKNRKIDLSGNFRSNAEIINGVNFIFEQLMTERFGGTDYGEKEKLTSGKETGSDTEKQETAIEILIIDSSDSKDDDFLDSTDEASNETEDFIAQEESDNREEDIQDIKSAEIEAMAVANRIHEMVNGESPLQIFDKKINGKRAVRYSDIAILVRSVKSVSACFDKVFKKSGIPLYAGSGSSYLDSFEVKVIISFLQIIDNPLQDIAITAVLYSPVYGVTADEMVKISKLESPGFFNKVTEYVTNDSNKCDILLPKLIKFLSDLENWQELALTTPISKLIDIILTETGYLNYAAVMLKGKDRQMNLLALKEHASKYEKSSSKVIFNFVRYIEKLKKSKIGEADISALSENDNVVRLLTIHKSKGLEFPVTFVSRTASKFNKQDERNPLIFDSNLGFGIQYLIIKNDVKYKIDTLSRKALKSKIRSDDISEQIRNLYVAATRAKEKLIFVGSVNDIGERIKKWERFFDYNEEKLPLHFISQTDNFLDMIMTAAYRNYDLFDISYFGKSDIIAKSSLMTQKNGYAKNSEFDLDKAAVEINESIMAEINTKFLWSYPYENDSRISAKVSVSEAKRIFQSLTETKDAEPMFKTEQSLTLPDFITGDKQITGSEKGMAIHTVMEHLDLNKHRCLSSIQSLVDELANKLILSEKLAKSVPINKIYNFSNSTLAERMRRSDNVKREVSFIMNVHPYEIYGESLNESEQNVIVQGVIDCFFEENGEIIIVDYKSDKGTKEDIALRYKKQMELYKEGIERSTEKKVKECLYYLFETEEEVGFEV